MQFEPLILSIGAHNYIGMQSFHREEYTSHDHLFLVYIPHSFRLQNTVRPMDSVLRRVSVSQVHSAVAL